jgi:ATP-binding cassette, subfamily B, bacterial
MGRRATIVESLPGARRTLRAFMPHVRRQRRLVVGSLVALVFDVLLRLVEPWPLKLVFDEVLRADGTPSRLPFIGVVDASTLVAAAALLLVVVTGLRAGASYLSTVGLALAGNRVTNDVRNSLYRHLQRLSLRFHAKSRGGDVVVRVIGDVGMVRDVVVTALLPLLGNALVLVGMLVVMFFVNVELTLITLATLPLFVIAASRRSRRIQEVSRRQREREGAIAATAAESIGAIKVVQALSLERQFREQFEGQANRSMKEGVKGARLAAGLERTVDLLIAVATAAVLWRGSTLVMSGALTPGDLIVFLTYLKNAFKPVRDFAKYTGRIAKASAAGERIVDVLEHEPEVLDRPGAVKAPRLSGEIAYEGVGFAYDKGVPVLEDIDLRIAPGETLALVGPSGHGKSTLVGMLLRLYDPLAGRVTVDGRDLRELTVDSLRGQISVLLQEPLLFHASIAENISYGSGVSDPLAIEGAARDANAAGFIEALPDGYATMVGERGVTLSNGQRQRIAIARAILRDAPIVILDEPMTGLDDDNAREVIEALERLCKGRTTLLISHDLAHSARADRIAYIERGRIVELGSHEELVARGGRYARLWEARGRGRHRHAGGIERAR